MCHWERAQGSLCEYHEIIISLSAYSWWAFETLSEKDELGNLGGFGFKCGLSVVLVSTDKYIGPF